MITSDPGTAGLPEYLDVLVVGGGLSGVGAGAHLRMRRPGTTFAILEAREAIGGTWDLFRYPGIRSDSDMYTLGYTFRPWRDDAAIADGSSILRYIQETAQAYDLGPTIRLRHRVVAASWSTPESRWTVEVELTDSGERTTLGCGFLFMCAGYYRYDEGYTPNFPGMQEFMGQIVHPQGWPSDLDYRGKRIVVIGSGATAVTLVPALAEQARHVTMLQRSPTYIASLPAIDPLSVRVKRLPAPVASFVMKWKNVLLSMLSFQLSRRRPAAMRRLLRAGLEKSLPTGFDIDRHFTPSYNPWDQRLCVVPDGDLFRVLSDERASIVTDRIQTFTPAGIRLESGDELTADIIVTATGLNMLALGGMEIVVDGETVTLSDTVAYKGMMFSGVPNLAAAVGYTNASWTLKCDLVCEYVCRLLGHMADHGFRQVVPRWPAPELPEHPFIDLSSGYVRRAVSQFPRQGSKAPWRLHQNYLRDLVLLRHRPLSDPALDFSAGSAPDRIKRAPSAAAALTT